jgi:hypothetical protein
MTVRVYGSSDDLIEVDGDIYEEFTAKTDDAGDLLAFSDGTLLSVQYDDNGLWRIHRLIEGSMTYEKIEATIDAEGHRDDGTPAYSDVVTLTGEVTWVVLGRAWARPRA